jgi:uncharacterized membrane protein YjjP (DUF1212 family)
VKTEGLEKKLSEILDELHRYSPHAWEQMVSYEFASAVTIVVISLFFLITSIACSWLSIKKWGDDADDFMPVVLASIMVSLVAILMIGSKVPSLFFPEAAVLRSIFE